MTFLLKVVLENGISKDRNPKKIGLFREPLFGTNRLNEECSISLFAYINSFVAACVLYSEPHSTLL